MMVIGNIIYFFLGFALVVYLNIPTLGIAIIGVFLMLNDLYKNQDIRRLKTMIQEGGMSEKSDEEEFFDE